MEDFRRLLNNRYFIILKKSYESQAEIARRKVENLPTSADITKFFKYLKITRDTAFVKLQQGFSLDEWKVLLQTTLLVVLVVNRKRVGDISSLLIEYYEKRISIADSMPDIYAQLSEEVKLLAKTYK